MVGPGGGDFAPSVSTAGGGMGGGKSIVTGKKSTVKHPRSGKGKRSSNIPISEKGSGFSEQKYKTTIKVKVKFKDGSTHSDEIKGLNAGHALARAKSNWPGAAVVKVK
jgi:hypothetical protein|tara:strand:- start:970 stop:1293 length:324 start_codon:yes stop_codon:yes gene_type:complete